MIDLCRQYGIVVTAYGPLGRPGLSQDPVNDPTLLDDPQMKEVAAKYGRTVAQILLRYLVRVINMASSLGKRKTNLKSLLLILFPSLTPADYARIANHSKVIQPSPNPRKFVIGRFRPCHRGHGLPR